MNTTNAGFSGASPSGGDPSMASRAKTAAAGAAQLAADKIDDNRATAADGLESAASTIHQKADALPGGDKVRGAAHATADALISTADYIRQKDAKAMMEDVQRLVRDNPGPALLGAAFLGFLIARSLSRD